jgi:hypothetical protein
MRSNNLFPISQKSQTGYIDRTGKIIIKPQYDLGCNFAEGLARVQVGNQWGYINKTGQYVIDLQDFDFACDFVEGLAQIRIAGNLGYIDKSGQIVIPPQFNWVQ